MFLIIGQQLIHKEFLTIILLSVDMEKEALLYIFQFSVTPTEMFEIPFKKFNTVNYLIGDSFNLLTNKDLLTKWFNKIEYPRRLPAIVFSKFNETDVKQFLKEGTKYKFLKQSNKFAGSGIYVVDSVKEVEQMIKITEEEDDYRQPGHTPSHWILQDTVEDLATFQGYKFHLRVLLIVVVRGKHVSVYMSNYHVYEFSKEVYDIKRIKKREVYNSHKHQNSRDAFFPMELPDTWTSTDATTTMENIVNEFKFIFKQQHDIQVNFNIKNGYQFLGADVLVDNKQNPYIIEINTRPVIYKIQDIFLLEYFHLGMGGSPMKLYSLIYGTCEERITPFSKPLQTFYETKYTSDTAISKILEDTFLVVFNLTSCNSYLQYQKMHLKMHHKRLHRTTKRKSRIVSTI